MPASTLTEFHHWLLAEETVGAPFLILRVGEEGPIHLAGAVARHLNEFDEESGGNWIALSQEVVLAIAADPAQRRLLGLDEPPSGQPPTSPSGIRKVLAALARRGHIVFDHPIALEVVDDESAAFLAAVGMPEQGLHPFHLVVNPERFHSRCIAPLIADSFLEWIASNSTPRAA